jgi:small subunit ribosomal protein S17
VATDTTTTTTESTASDRGLRRLITGTVTSAKMNKTVIVSVTRRLRDKKFHKFISRRIRYAAHDELNTCKPGDLVELIETAPYSKTKRFRVFRTIEKAREDVQ